jgi:hypothetical protein
MAPKKAKKGKYTIQNIPVENLSPNPFLEIPTWAKSREIMQDIGDAQKWTTKMGALLNHSPQQCQAVADILARGCARGFSSAQTEMVYSDLWPGFSSAVYWIYENAETVEQARLYELLYVISQEVEDMNKLEPSEAQRVSRLMLDAVRFSNDMVHDKTHLQVAEFLASGGQFPDLHEWNFEEMLKGSGLEQRVQPRFPRLLLNGPRITRASHANNIPQ